MQARAPAARKFLRGARRVNVLPPSPSVARDLDRADSPPCIANRESKIENVPPAYWCSGDTTRAALPREVTAMHAALSIFMTKALSGLIAAPHTPFRADGALALDVIPQQAQLLAKNGVAGAFVCGTTGEGASLTSDERRRVVEAWAAAKPDSIALIVHVGHLSLGEASEFARHAQETGADAIATIAPSFFKPGNVEDLVAWCAKVAAAAPNLPFYYYHMPAMTGVSFAATDFLRAATDRIPTLAGVKFTHENLMDYSRAAEFDGGRYNVLFGRDEILLAALALGARGAVGSTYNYASPLYARIISAFGRGDIATARRHQSQAMEFIEIHNRYGGLVAGKAMMKLVGVDCGPVRLPLRAITAQDEAKLRADLEKIGFFDYCSKL
jgi:N-acetylneuraminate lyase